MSKSSPDSDTNVHHSDSEQERAKYRRAKYRPFRLPDYKPYKEAKDETVTVQFVDYTEQSNVTVQDGMMKAPPTVTSPEAENVPMTTEISEDEAKETENDYIPSPEEQICNTRALSKYSSKYELEKFEKNAMIIFNQENVDGYPKRQGTEKDVEALENTFKRFGFEVTERKDRAKVDLVSELKACEFKTIKKNRLVQLLVAL